MIQVHHDLTFENFNLILKALVTKELQNVPISKGSQAAVIALSWSTVLAKNALNNESNEFKKLVEYQRSLYQYAVSSGNPKTIDVGYKILTKLWTEKPDLENVYFKLLLTAEPSSDGIILISAILDFTSDNLLLNNNKIKLIDYFIKSLVTVKSKPNVHHFASCKRILKSFNTDDFKTTLFPALQRGILRAPEIILQGVGMIVKDLEIDISDFAFDIGKILIQNLYSKDDNARSESAESLKELAKKCSKAEPIEKLLKQIFAVINGSDGKITVVEYRINIYQGAGNLSFNQIDEKQLTPILETATDCFIKALETEIHEKILCHSLEMFGLWTVKLKGEIPKKLIHCFNKGMELKTTTQLVRTCYLQWILSALKNGQLPEGLNLSNSLLKTVEKSVQNSTQILALSEGICSACILLVIDVAPSDGNTFWNIILDMNKQLFLSERFLQAAPVETLCCVMLLCEKLLCNHFDRLKGSPLCIYKAIVYSVNSHSKKVCYLFSVFKSFK